MGALGRCGAGGVPVLQGLQRRGALSVEIINSGSIASTAAEVQEDARLLPDIGVAFVQGDELSKRNGE